jgi:hypothetical protein
VAQRELGDDERRTRCFELGARAVEALDIPAVERGEERLARWDHEVDDAVLERHRLLVRSRLEHGRLARLRVASAPRGDRARQGREILVHLL